MRRSRASPPSGATPYRTPNPQAAPLHHHAQQQQHQKQAVPDSASLLIRSFHVEANPTRPMRPSPLTASAIPDIPLDLADRIRSFPLFSSAPDDFLAAIGAHLKPQVHAAQDHILTEGDEAKAMYWLVRGVVAVTSRDGEAVYAELRPGAFFGEIGVLMDVPRTATIVARTKCLVVVLKKEDLQAELPKFPDMEKAIRHEAQERLTILRKKRQENGGGGGQEAVSAAQEQQPDQPKPPVARDAAPGEVTTGEVGVIREGGAVGIVGNNNNNTSISSSSSSSSNSNNNSKKRKSPGPGALIEDEAVGGSALGSGYVHVRKTLKELPLFSTLPPDILHFLGLSAQPKSYSPFTDIVRQGTPGNEIFFIVRGEAEVIHETAHASGGVSVVGGAGSLPPIPRMPYVRPRLRQGQYFGEVASLGLSEGRTATVRSITTVECLIIGGDALEELWRRCPPEIKRQVEATARTRYRRKSGDGDDHDHDPDDEDVEMQDAGGAEKTLRAPSPLATQNLPQMAFTTTPSLPPSPTKEDDDSETRQPSDPDPYLSVDMENLRNRRRNSLAPPPAQQAASDATITGLISGGIKTTTTTTTIHAAADHEGLMMMRASPQTLTPPEDTPGPFKRARTLPSRPHSAAALEEDDEERRKAGPRLPDTILVRVFRHLDILEMLRLRAVCRQWRHVLEESPQLCTHVDLGSLNRRVTDGSLAHVFAPFIGQRPVEVDISNCFHVTDEGFQALWRQCGQNVKVWKMRSVWEVSASQILEMSESAKGLEEVDWSNCRKVGDSLLARVVGWVVPETTATRESSRNVVISSSNAKARAQQQQQQKQQQAATTSTQGSGPAPGTVVGCPSLRRLNLSYCKHITDRSMAHLAAHASSRLERLSLTRCTSITDAGFQSWAPYRFAALTHLSLADCTYLSDKSIVALVNAAKNLTHLDLSFCCALSDTSTEVVALSLPRLRELRLAFCGSAVSDASLGCVALHLNELRGLSVRGCVRVTGVGVENVLEGCARLDWLDVSQCKNLAGWLGGGGVERWGFDDRGGSATTPPKDAAGTSRGGVVRGGRTAQGRPLGGPGPMLRPVIAPSGATMRRRKPVRFIVQKGTDGLR